MTKKMHLRINGVDCRGQGQSEFEYAHQTACGRVGEQVTFDGRNVDCRLCLQEMSHYQGEVIIDEADIGKEYKMLTKAEEMTGKTILRTVDTVCSDLIVIFTDDTYVNIIGHQQYDEDAIAIFSKDELTHHERLETGMITEAEFKELHRIEVERCNQVNIDRRRAQFEKLKIEFEGSVE